MNSSLPVGDRLALVGQLASDTHAAATAKYSDPVDMSQFESAAFIVTTGAVADKGSLQLQESTTSAFTTPVDLGDPIALTTEKPVMVGVHADQLDVNNGSRYVRVKLLGTGGSVKAGVAVIGLNARYKPAAHGDDSVVVG